jgi:FMN phosphatase YigB (HAD superfamily)
MEVKKIYFDMDGVLADFDRGVQELCGMEYVPQEQRVPGFDDAMWKAIREVGHFYDKLELMSGAEELFLSVYEKYGSRCEILTGIPKPKRGIVTAGDDKKSWTRRNLSENVVVNIVYREQKPEYCTGKDCILIDDLEKNIEAWESYGGTGILHKRTEETIARLRELGVLKG